MSHFLDSIERWRGSLALWPAFRLHAGSGIGEITMYAMRHVNITIGPLRFDHADYDAENDVLYLHVGVPQPAEGEETPEGHVVRYAPGTSRVIGLTVLGARHVLERDGRLVVTITDAVETTADQLAPALAAV